MNMPALPSERLSMASRQQGVALVIALVFLLLLTIIGVTAMQTATLQERMAGNVRDRNVGMQAGEFALRDAEQMVDAGVSLNAAFIFTGGNAPDWRNTDCSDGTVNVVTDGDLSAEVDNAPCYFAERFVQLGLTPGNPEFRYRITAFASGRSPDSRVVVRSSYRTAGN